MKRKTKFTKKSFGKGLKYQNHVYPKLKCLYSKTKLRKYFDSSTSNFFCHPIFHYYFFFVFVFGSQSQLNPDSKALITLHFPSCPNALSFFLSLTLRFKSNEVSNLKP